MQENDHLIEFQLIEIVFFLLDQNYVNHLIEFFDTFHLIKLFDQLIKKN